MGKGQVKGGGAGLSPKASQAPSGPPGMTLANLRGRPGQVGWGAWGDNRRREEPQEEGLTSWRCQMSLRLRSPPRWAEGGRPGWALSRKGEEGGEAGPLARGCSSLGEQLMGHLAQEPRPGYGSKQMMQTQDGGWGAMRGSVRRV